MTSPIERLTVALSDRYAIKRELGAGGMATVYLARDLKHDRDVAIKVLRPELAAALGADRFLREIKITAQLTHPHILPLLDSGTAEEQPTALPPYRPTALLFYVMPYIDGASLRERLDAVKQLSVDEVVKIAVEVADALGFAHAHDVVHRDVKPENILLQAGHAVVADFGIARAITVAGGDSLTETGLALGTPAYMSTEQAAGESDLDGRSDIYSLGCVVYELLAGQPPFTGPTVESIVHQQVAADPPHVTSIRSGVPDGLDAVLRKALSKTPADRYASARDFAEAVSTTVTVSLSAVKPSRASPVVEKSIAVLPFANMSPDPEMEYFSDGMTEEIINELSQFRDLHVVARTSCFAFKGQGLDVREIGEKLNVGTVLEGSVRQAGKRLRITAQLIDVSDGYHLWSERFDRQLEDVFEIQDEIAQEIGSALQSKLATRGAGPIVSPGTDNLEAYQLYLKGQHHWNQRYPGNQRRAIDYFRRAIDLDADYALPYAGLADAYFALSMAGVMNPREAYDQVQTAVKRAMQLDDSTAEVRCAMAKFLGYMKWDFPGAVSEYEAAIALNPNCVEAYGYLGVWLIAVGRADEAVEHATRAIEIDPLSANAHAFVAWAYYFTERPTDAVLYARGALELDPNGLHGLWALSTASVKLEQYETATKTMEKLAALSGRAGLMLSVLAWVYAAAGRRDDAKSVIEELRQRATVEYIPLSHVGLAHLVMGETDAAFECWTRAIDNRETGCVQLVLNPEFESIRSDPRFQALLERMCVK